LSERKVKGRGKTTKLVGLDSVVYESGKKISAE